MNRPEMESVLKIRDCFTLLRRWIADERATAFTEGVVLLPVLSVLLMGCFDIGQAIAVNQKTIGASQMIGDLIARDRSVTMSGLEDIIKAGELAIEPYSSRPFGYDIASIEFDDGGDPEILWRVTRGTSPNDSAVQSTEGIGSPGDGVIVVTAAYRYTPYFYKFLMNEIEMKEVAFLHGRRSATVVCGDCAS